MNNQEKIKEILEKYYLIENQEMINRCSHEILELTNKDKEEIDRLRVQLAGCEVAALGYAKDKNDCKKGDYGWSKSFEDVKNLYKKYIKLTNRPLSEKEVEKVIEDNGRFLRGIAKDPQGKEVENHYDVIPERVAKVIASHFSKPQKPNMELEFRHTKTGCGGRLKMNMTLNELKDLKDLLSLSGLDMEITAVEYPYMAKLNGEGGV